MKHQNLQNRSVLGTLYWQRWVVVCFLKRRLLAVLHLQMQVAFGDRPVQPLLVPVVVVEVEGVGEVE